MSYHEYKMSQHIAGKDHPFYAIIMAAMRQADPDNSVILKHAWPHVWDELNKRYHAVGGILASEDVQLLIDLEADDD